MKSLRKCALTIGLMVSMAAAQASIIGSNDIDFGASKITKTGGGWSIGKHEQWGELFDQKDKTGINFDRDLSCTDHNQWGSCIALGNAGSSISHDPIVIDIVFHKEWDITSHKPIHHDIKSWNFKFFDIDDIEVNKSAGSFANVINAKFFVTNTKNQPWLNWDGDFRLKEIEMHGTHSSISRASDTPPVEVSAPATLGLLSLGSMLLLRRRV